MDTKSEIAQLRKLILKYNNQFESTQDEEFKEDLLDAIEGCFQQIAFLELRLASQPTLGVH